MKLIHRFLAFGLILPAFSAVSAQETGPVGQLTAQFQQAQARSLAPIEEEKGQAEAAYLEQLAGLEKDFMERGDLEGMLEIKKEREAFAKSRTTGGGELGALDTLRDAYRESLVPLEEKRAEAIKGLQGVYRKSLEDIQTDQTKAGNIEEALKAKAILDRLDKEVTKGTPGRKMAVKSDAPWTAPPPSGENILEGGTFLEPITIPAGRHRLRNRLVFGAREPARRNDVYLLEGTSISCTDKGEIFVMAGNGHAFGVEFESAYITAGLAADWHFINCALDRTRLAKGDTWKGRPQASRWILENCTVSGDFFETWNTQDVGYQASRSTFDRVKFPDLEYRQEAGTLAQSETLVMKDCLFRNCELPLSVLISTVNCAFDDCSFRDDGKPFSITSPITVKVFAKDCTNRIRNLPERIKLEIEPMENVEGEVGAAAGAGNQ